VTPIFENNATNRPWRAIQTKKGLLKYQHASFSTMITSPHQVLETKAVMDIFGAGDANRFVLEMGQSFGEKERMNRRGVLEVFSYLVPFLFFCWLVIGTDGNGN
jgi:hypothetical protein